MKSGIVLIPFVDGKTGNAYKVNDDFKVNKKRFEELLKAGLISDGKEVSEEETEEVQNEETVEEETEEESVEPENGKEVSEEETEEVSEDSDAE